MAVLQYKKYKIVTDKNGNKTKIEKSKEQWNKETCNGTKTWYFSDRYKTYDKNKLYKSKSFSLKREAEDEERLFLLNPIDYIIKYGKRSKNALKLNDTKISIKKVLNDYYDDFFTYELTINKGGTAYDHKKAWNKHISYKFGNLTPDSVKLATVQEWHEESNIKINPRTNDLYSVNTKNTWNSTLSDFLAYLFSHGLIEMNYCKIVGNFKQTNKNKINITKVRYQTAEEFEKFMSVIDDDFWLAFFSYSFWHGPRKGEQRALKIKKLNIEEETIEIDETFSKDQNGKEHIGSIKNGNNRIIYLAKQSKSYINKLLEFYKSMDNYSDNWYLFGGPEKLSKERIDRALKKYYAILKEKYPNEKIIELTHHEFGRHSHASYLMNTGIEKGLPLDVVIQIIAERLGDTTTVIRNTYAHPYVEKYNKQIKNILN